MGFSRISEELLRNILITLLIAGLTAFSGWSAEQATDYLGIHDVWAYRAVKYGIIVGFSFLLIRFSALRLLPLVRKRLYEVSNLEGYWASRVNDDERPYSISKIYYHSPTASWRHRGYALDEHFRVVAQWRSRSLHFDDRSDHWFFRGQWHELDEDRTAGRSRDHLVVHMLAAGVTDRFGSLVIDDVFANPDREDEGPTVVRTESFRVLIENFRRGGAGCPGRRIEEVLKMRPERLKGLIDATIPHR
ncbi:MAG: hypothetical protein ACOY45_01615 [Pseudomonadota bacterium]